MTQSMLTLAPGLRLRLRAAFTSLFLLAGAAHPAACSSSQKSDGEFDSGGAAGGGQAGTSGGSSGSAGEAGAAGSSGVAGSAGGDSGPPECRGNPGTPTVGKSCGCNDDCDFGERCAAETSRGGPPGGMCVRLCAVDGTCPAGFGCIELESGNPQTATCFPLCEVPGDCRAGFVCGPLTSGIFSILSAPPRGSFCVPFCQSDEDCPHTGSCNRLTGVCNEPADPGRNVGDPCTNVNQCAGLICDPGAPAGGYCMTWCSVSKQGCPDGSACGQQQDGDWGFCVKTCSSAADCRAGYVCEFDPAANAEVCLP